MNSDTWHPAGVTIPVGGTHSSAFNIPANQRVEATIGFAGGVETGAAMPEGAALKPIVIRGEYEIWVAAATWVVGAVIQVHTRIVKKTMDFITGAAIVDPGYTLVLPEFANERYHFHRFHHMQFVAGVAMGVMRVPLNVKVRGAALQEDESVWMLVQNTSNIDVNFRMHARMLVQAGW